MLVGYSVGVLVVVKGLVDRVYLCMWFVTRLRGDAVQASLRGVIYRLMGSWVGKCGVSITGGSLFIG